MIEAVLRWIVLTIRDLKTADFEGWLPLWEAYIEFYEASVAPAITTATFERLVAGDVMRGAIAYDDTTAVGFVNWVWHPGTWSTTENFYLEDLFVAPHIRGTGAGRALIAHVTEAARAAGARTIYWHTQRSNATARRLYDDVATDTDFMHYEIRL